MFAIATHRWFALLLDLTGCWFTQAAVTMAPVKVLKQPTFLKKYAILIWKNID